MRGRTGGAGEEAALSGHDIAVTESPGTALNADLLIALRRLPTRQREVPVLRAFLDLDIETTANHLGLAPGTVRAHQSRAMTALRSDLASEATSPREQPTTPEEAKR